MIHLTFEIQIRDFDIIDLIQKKVLLYRFSESVVFVSKRLFRIKDSRTARSLIININIA